MSEPAVIAPRPQRRRRALALAALVLSVVAVHGCVGRGIAERLADAGVEAAMPARIEVAYLREMVAAAPPLAPPAAVAPVPAARRPTPRAPREAAVAASAPASAPDTAAADALATAASAPAASPPQEPPQEPPPASDPAAPPPAARPDDATPVPPAATAAASQPAAPASASGGGDATAFSWPSSTRLRYALTGNYRGQIDGTAEVEWIRQGDRYQTHVDVTVGLPFAPLLVRRTSSEGRLSADGLRPERYDEDSKAAFRDRRHATVRFEPDAVVLANGERRERPAGVQDSASQFVQLTWLFTSHPERLVPGGVVELPLALPRKVDRWIYEVAGAETLATPIGPLDTFHLQPRRAPEPGSTLTAEMWLAPSLRYMPVRIRIRQDDDTFIDLLIDRRPEIAE